MPSIPSNHLRYRNRLARIPVLRGPANAAVAWLGAILRCVRPKAVLPHDFAWREIDPPLFASLMLIDGRRSQQTGRLWRRRTAAGDWEYRQDVETYDEFIDRQW